MAGSTIPLTDAAVAERVLRHIAGGTTDMGEEIWREPVANYRCETRFGQELEVLRRFPLAFCPSAALADVGSYVARDTAGVPIVAGTDGWGLELVREIEIYRQAGMSAAEALQTATINPARLVGVADRTGSIAVGKEADMVLVAGDVSSDLGALRRVVTVVSDGYVMDGDALRAAAGYSGMPK